MIQLADLHTHSTASDGQCSPARLVAKARQAGVEVLALTDHDTISGLDEAIQAGQALGLTVLRGPVRTGICTFWVWAFGLAARNWRACAVL